MGTDTIMNVVLEGAVCADGVGLRKELSVTVGADLNRNELVCPPPFVSRMKVSSGRCKWYWIDEA